MVWVKPEKYLQAVMTWSGNVGGSGPEAGGPAHRERGPGLGSYMIGKENDHTHVPA